MASADKTRIDSASENALWSWCADMIGLGAKMYGEKDLVLSTTCSARFGLQIDEDGALSLGIPRSDTDAFTLASWSSAAFLRNYQNGNYLALSSQDISVEDSEGGGKVPLCLYFPITADKIAVFESEHRPEKFRLRAMKVKRDGSPTLAIGEPRAEIPIVYQNFPKKHAA